MPPLYIDSAALAAQSCKEDLHQNAQCVYLDQVAKCAYVMQRPYCHAEWQLIHTECVREEKQEDSDS